MTPGVCLAVPSWRFWLFGVCLLISVCITFHFFVTVYLVLKAPPSCRWFSVLLLCIPALCSFCLYLCSFFLYPCSPSRLLLFIYHMCLPLPVVLTPLLYVALCMPRTALAAFMAFGVCFYSSLSVFVCVASLCLFYCVPGLYLLVPCVRISCRNLADNRLCGAGYEPVSMLATPGCSSLPMVGLF